MGQQALTLRRSPRMKLAVAYECTRACVCPTTRMTSCEPNSHCDHRHSGARRALGKQLLERRLRHPAETRLRQLHRLLCGRLLLSGYRADGQTLRPPHKTCAHGSSLQRLIANKRPARTGRQACSVCAPGALALRHDAACACLGRVSCDVIAGAGRGCSARAAIAKFEMGEDQRVGRLSRFELEPQQPAKPA